MTLEKVLGELCDVFAEQAVAWWSEFGTFSERAVCANVAEQLQRSPRKLVVVNGAPYPSGRPADERIADLKVFFDDRGTERPLWIEVKPVLYGSNYWNYGRFFTRFDAGNPALSPSDILDDLDKSTLVPNDPFALILLIAGNEACLAPNGTAPGPNTSLLAGQVMHLCKSRLEHKREQQSPLMVTTATQFGPGAQWPFCVVAIAAEADRTVPQ